MFALLKPEMANVTPQGPNAVTWPLEVSFTRARHIVSEQYITRILHLYCICTASLLLWTGCSKNSILSSRCKLRDMCIWICIGRCIFHLDLNLDLNVRMSMFMNLSTIWRMQANLNCSLYLSSLDPEKQKLFCEKCNFQKFLYRDEGVLPEDKSKR